jgi:glycosyltransferase involved in cell wall biosynthesis
MAVGSHRRSGPAEIWMLGPLPPPVTGMTVLTQAIVRAMQAAGPVRFLSWSPGMWQRNLRMRLRRNFRILVSMAKLISHGRVTNQRLYLVANSQSGLYLTAMLVFVGRRLGYTVYLHHHVYNYIDRYDWRVGWIDRCLAGRGVHVVHDEKMIRDFRSRYRTKNEFIVVHPSIVGIEIGRARESSHRPFRLGLLSSLSPAKGLDVAIELFQSLRKAGRDVALTLAGPAASANARRLIETTIAEHPQHAVYLGPVYDDAKALFFANIDAFVFPTVTESWGLVLNEALGAGVPVITFDRGCTATVVGTSAGLVIDPNESFVRAATSQIERWMDCEDEYLAASRSAVAQAQYLHHEGRRTLDDFVSHMFSDFPMREDTEEEGVTAAVKTP